MKITRSQLKKLIQESMWDSVETGSQLIEFARAYASLGDAVQRQVDSIVSAWNSGGRNSDVFLDAAYEQNPNAIELALERLDGFYNLGEEYEELMDALRTSLTVEPEYDTYLTGELQGR